MESLKQFWSKLDPDKRRRGVIIAALVLVVAALWQFLNVEEYQREESAEEQNVSLTGNRASELGMDAIDSRLREVESSRDQMEQEIERLREERNEAEELAADQTQEIEQDYEQRMEELQQRIDEQQQQLREREAQALEPVQPEPQEREPQVSVDDESAEEPSAADDDPAHDEDLWRDESAFQHSDSQQMGASGEAEQEPSSVSVSMQVIESEESESEQGPDEADSGDSQFLPAGSIISGTFMTGLDAPTTQEARSEPHPALIRIKDETILPNRYRADMRECFLVVSGYGDMSTERAYLRTEKLSCINNDGDAMETSLEAWAVGEDGSAGIRGRLVRRTGQMIARASLASFTSAAADVFGSSPVPTIQTEGSDQVPFQQALSGDAAQASALQGAGDAMERIAEYYLDMADSIFPIVEVSAGRQVDLVLNHGATIDFSRNR